MYSIFMLLPTISELKQLILLLLVTVITLHLLLLFLDDANPYIITFWR